MRIIKTSEEARKEKELYDKNISDANKCPECESKDINRRYIKGFYSNKFDIHCKCNSCGCEWVIEDVKENTEWD